MNEAHKQFQETFEELNTLTIGDKIKFLEELLFQFTLAGRAIWSDVDGTDAEKLNAYKWLNELLHRIWNVRQELQQGDDKDSVTRLHENMKFYGGHSGLLMAQLVPTTLGAFKNFKFGDSLK